MTTLAITQNISRTDAVKMLADMVRADPFLTGEDVADIAAFADEDALCEGHSDDDAALLNGPYFCDGTCVPWCGPSRPVAYALVRSSSALGESAYDLMQSVTTLLDW